MVKIRSVAALKTWDLSMDSNSRSGQTKTSICAFFPCQSSFRLVKCRRSSQNPKEEIWQERWWLRKTLSISYTETIGPKVGPLHNLLSPGLAKVILQRADPGTDRDGSQRKRWEDKWCHFDAFRSPIYTRTEWNRYVLKWIHSANWSHWTAPPHNHVCAISEQIQNNYVRNMQWATGYRHQLPGNRLWCRFLVKPLCTLGHFWCWWPTCECWGFRIKPRNLQVPSRCFSQHQQPYWVNKTQFSLQYFAASKLSEVAHWTVTRETTLFEQLSVWTFFWSGLGFLWLRWRPHCKCFSAVWLGYFILGPFNVWLCLRAHK